jgi:hypothetical protein
LASAKFYSLDRAVDTSDVRREAAFIAAVLTATAGLGTGLAWLNRHIPAAALAPIAVLLGFLALRFMVRGIANWYDDLDDFHYDVDRGVFIGQFAIAVLIAVGAGVAMLFTPLRTAAAYMYALAILAPVVWLLYADERRDRKECPDCREIVKLRASICRFCGFRFAPPPYTGPERRRSPHRRRAK